MGKRRLIGKIVILMLGLAAVVILAANSDTIPVSTPKKGYRVVICLLYTSPSPRDTR